jgi:hypothetical protein
MDLTHKSQQSENSMPDTAWFQASAVKWKKIALFWDRQVVPERR